MTLFDYIFRKGVVPIKKLTDQINKSGLNSLLIILPLLYLGALLIYPLINLFKLSLFDEEGFTFEYIGKVLTTPVYIDVIYGTIKISVIVTVITIVICYPIAYLLYRIQSRKWKSIILAGVLIPFWISLLVRTFSWIVILQNKGIINYFLAKFNFIIEPIQLLYNTESVVVGMVHVLYPFMFFSIYSVISSIDSNLIDAAKGLGSKSINAFLKITLPLSLPGVLAGSVIVFVMSLGFFVTPALIGGADSIMVSMLIETYINSTLNWNLASALSVVLFSITFILLYIAYLVIRKQNLFKEVS